MLLLLLSIFQSLATVICIPGAIRQKKYHEIFLQVVPRELHLDKVAQGCTSLLLSYRKSLFTIQNIMLTLKNTECKQINIYFEQTTRSCVEMHCFLCRQLQNTACKIINLCGTIYSNFRAFLCLKNQFERQTLCYIVFGSGMGNTF